MFREPDWNQAVDFGEQLAAIPPSASMRGMFFQFLLRSVPASVRAKYGTRHYIAFKNYAMREYVEVMQDACEADSTVSPAQSLRRLGWGVYPSYADTMTGTAIFAVAGRSFARMIEVCPAAYRVGLAPATVNIRSLSTNHAEVEFRDCFNVPEFHQVGIWEGAMKVCEVEGVIKTEVIGAGAVNFDISWR